MGEPASAISLFNPFIPIRDERSALKAARIGAVALWGVAVFNIVEAVGFFLRTGSAGDDSLYSMMEILILLVVSTMQWIHPRVWIARVTALFALLLLFWNLLFLANVEDLPPRLLGSPIAMDIAMCAVTFVLSLVGRRGADWLKRAARAVPAT